MKLKLHIPLMVLAAGFAITGCNRGTHEDTSVTVEESTPATNEAIPAEDRVTSDVIIEERTEIQEADDLDAADEVTEEVDIDINAPQPTPQDNNPATAPAIPDMQPSTTEPRD